MEICFRRIVSGCKGSSGKLAISQGRVIPTGIESTKAEEVMATIPLEAHLITLLVSEQRTETRHVQMGRTVQTRRVRVTEQREIAPGETAGTVREGLAQANQILASTSVSFQIASIDNHRIAAPHDREVVTENGFLFLARRIPARRGVRLFVVCRFENQEAGLAVEEQRACIVKHLRNPLFGKTLAHELGHLLSLDHVTTGSRASYNLMWPGLRHGDELAPDQIREARNSALARAFPGQQNP